MCARRADLPRPPRRYRRPPPDGVRLGILGGSFDPPHHGHLLAASDAFEALALDRLFFVPAGRQPFKEGKIAATGVQRVEMLRLLIDGDPRFAIDTAELERPGLSFTVDTVAALQEREPCATLFLLIGADLVSEFPLWHEAERLAAMVEVIVLVRDGDVRIATPPGRPSMASQRETAHGRPLARAEVPMRRIATRRVDISATEIRARVRAGASIRGFVPDAVAAYITRAALYRERTTC